jgi:aspartyl-tRNA(Asn)/glutamyl-tRNA(Gln) amidotransferase subunit C
MPIDAAAVRHCAKLAGLRIDDDQIEKTAQELDAIMGFVAQLDDVDVEGVEPMIMTVQHSLPMREDVVTEGGDPNRILSNAPVRAGDYFVVPKVID